MKKNNFLVILIVVIVFGFAAGVAGGIISRVYLLDRIYGIPMFGEINLGNNPYNKPNLIISGAKKVVVENNEKINETINTASRSLVGIFNKKNNPLNKKEIYIPNEYMGQGLVITSDGWIVSRMDLENINISDYVVITKDKKIYEIDRVVDSEDLSIVFIHLKDANNLPVKQFTERQSLKSGSTVVAINWLEDAFIDSISNLSFDKNGLVRSSDNFVEKINLSNRNSLYYDNFFVFDLSGGFVGWLNESGEVMFINNFVNLFQTIPEKNEIKKIEFGVNFIPISQLIIKGNDNQEGALISKNEQGIAVEPGSPSYKAGLKEGDVIISVNGTRIDQSNSLTEIIQRYKQGDTLEVFYLREDVENKVSIKL